MVMTGFRVVPSDLVRARKKVGLVALSKYLRALFMMWLNDEIKVSEDDVRKYNG